MIQEHEIDLEMEGGFIKPDLFKVVTLDIEVKKGSRDNNIVFPFKPGIDLLTIMSMVHGNGSEEAFKMCPACLSDPVWVPPSKEGDGGLYFTYKDDIASKKWTPELKSMTRRKEILMFFDDDKPLKVRGHKNRDVYNKKGKAHQKLVLNVKVYR